MEPYAGGASVALSLLFEEYASDIHINDLNRGVYAFWAAVLDQTEELCGRIAGAEMSMAEWQRQRAVLRAAAPDPLDLAFATFFLNRTNRSGIIDGGVIGGQQQTGEWKLDARFNKPTLIQRIQKIARFRSRITLTRINAAEYLRSTVPALPAASFLYLDPPYYVQGSGLYETAYERKDHVEIARLVAKLRRPWMVSYDATAEIVGLYAAYEPLVYGLSYSAQDRYRGREVIFLRPDLEQPDIDSPANIKFAVIDGAQRALLLG